MYYYRPAQNIWTGLFYERVIFYFLTGGTTLLSTAV